ncbi:hypothetical protein BD410DRAFT_48973 [Rickenella mellea]|uniref:BTB domain-containing protein n=1 Tax=Rickenella mellea TaxID=50990 RepID=A0A4R5XH70_9AGAM|nr:hypothetical protein BD410DRAFT_48973 [Rickenella mellea]
MTYCTSCGSWGSTRCPVTCSRSAAASERCNEHLESAKFPIQISYDAGTDANVSFLWQASDGGSPDIDQGEGAGAGNTFISVSTTFYPGANNDPSPTDCIVLSSDSVFFYVHSHRILAASENGFDKRLPVGGAHHQQQKKDENDPDPIISLPQSSSVLNILLHTVYDMSCSHYSPTIDDLAAAVEAMGVYGIPLRSHITSSSPLFSTLVSHAPTSPLEVYSLAAMYDIYDLAVSASPHLLSFSLSSLTDDMARRIGPVYLKRLFFLHLGRTDALKRLLLPPPHPHAPTQNCDFLEQKKLTRAWALASAYLTWDARPDMSAGTMEAALHPLGDHLSCNMCRDALRERVSNLVVQWSVVKRTI